MNTEVEVAKDALVEAIDASVIASFRAERVTSYFLDEPGLAVPAIYWLHSAEALRGRDPDGAHALATQAIKYTVTELFFTAIVSGLTRDEHAVDSFAHELMEKFGVEDFHRMLMRVLERLTGGDLTTHFRPGSTRPFWDEIEELRGNPDTEQAEMAVEVAHHLVWILLPLFLARFGIVLPAVSPECSAQRNRAPSDPAEVTALPFLAQDFLACGGEEG